MDINCVYFASCPSWNENVLGVSQKRTVFLCSSCTKLQFWALGSVFCWPIEISSPSFGCCFWDRRLANCSERTALNWTFRGAILLLERSTSLLGIVSSCAFKSVSIDELFVLISSPKVPVSCEIVWCWLAVFVVWVSSERSVDAGEFVTTSMSCTGTWFDLSRAETVMWEILSLISRRFRSTEILSSLNFVKC